MADVSPGGALLTGLRAIVYRVPDLDRAKLWYQKAVGKPPVYDSPIAVIFAVGDVMLNLAPADEAAPTGAPQAVAYWDVEDIEDAHRKLIEAGAAARGEIIVTAVKSRAATLVDPFGNTFGIVGKPSAGRQSLDDQPSQSALGVTLFRAFATRDARPEIRGHDDLAEKFLPEEFRKIVDNPAARDWLIAKAPGSYEYFIARTAFFDAAVSRALDENVPQIVFLGAGYDSRAYRFADRIRDTRIFELDAPSTQQRKKAMLRQAGVTVPGALTFAAVDFARDSLDDVLGAAGMDKNQRTLYVWEGVTYYLTASAVDRTLACIRRNSPAGSELCLDYMIDAPDMASRYGVAQSQALMRDTYHAEPVQLRIPEGTLEAFLAERGYATLDHLLAGDLEEIYLTLSTGDLAGHVLACFGLVRAAIER
jgi:methyltransferase (TIGR00027 family)